MMMRLICLLIVTLATLLASSEAQGKVPNKALDLDWSVFIKKHGKSYKNPAEEFKRRLIWEENVEFIAQHSHSKLNESFQLKMNKFGDLTFEEFKQKITGLKHDRPSKAKVADRPSKYQAPDSIDWRPSGCVSQPIDEGQCGANWAFGVVGSIESMACLNHQGVLNVLSVQQLVDCTYDSGNMGCDGGYFLTSYEYFISFGVQTNTSYPYMQRLGTCVYDKSHVRVVLKDYVRVQDANEAALTEAIGTLGPVTAGVYVTNAFRFYSGGIFYDPDCRSDTTDLGGVIVGYGTLGDNRNYYIFRNNWGSDWGDDGYVYMSRGKDNNCGIATDCYYPVF